MKISYVLLASSFLLSACVSQYPTDKELNWLDLGKRAANRGELLIDQQALAERYKIEKLTTESFVLYQEGYQEGLQSFCKINNAFNFGIRGGNYKGQCEGVIANEEQFKYEWSKAYQKFMFPEGPK